MGKLCELRSTLVHVGDSGTVNDTDLGDIKALVRRTLVNVLTDARFSSMREARELDDGCDEQLLGEDYGDRASKLQAR